MRVYPTLPNLLPELHLRDRRDRLLGRTPSGGLAEALPGAREIWIEGRPVVLVDDLVRRDGRLESKVHLRELVRASVDQGPRNG